MQYAPPDQLVPGPRYLIPALAAPLLIALVIANPRRYHRGSRDLRWLSITLIAVINAANAASLVLLVRYLLTGGTVSYTHLRAHETPEHLVCRLLLEKKKTKNTTQQYCLST